MTEMKIRGSISPENVDTAAPTVNDTDVGDLKVISSRNRNVGLNQGAFRGADTSDSRKQLTISALEF